MVSQKCYQCFTTHCFVIINFSVTVELANLKGMLCKVNCNNCILNHVWTPLANLTIKTVPLSGKGVHTSHRTVRTDLVYGSCTDLSSVDAGHIPRSNIFQIHQS